jgi:hypothetical protein
MLNRQLITPAIFRNMCSAQGIGSDLWQNRYLDLANTIPGPGDIVHFVLRHGFEPSVIRANDLDKEFPTSARDWLAKQGLNYEFTIKDPFTGEEAKTTFADMYWQTHWVPISPGQAYVMNQRLRPDRIALYQDIVPGVKPFTLEDVKRWLRINDYPPGIRDQLTAISYNPIGIRFLRQLYQTGEMGKAELANRFQDLGYTPDDSVMIAAATAKALDSQKKAKLKRITEGRILEAYDIGAISRDEAAIKLYELTIDDLILLDEFRDLPPEQQQAIANDDINVIHTLADFDVQSDLINVKEWIRAIKKRFLTGKLTFEQAYDQLGRVGITTQAREKYIQLWGYELQTSAKEIGAAKLLHWFSQGIISLADVAQRLTNLGYGPLDIPYMLQEARIDLITTVAKQAKQSAAAQAAAEKAIQSKIHTLEIQQNKARSELAKFAGPTKLVAWYSTGYITDREMKARLPRLVQDVEKQRGYLDDAYSKRAKLLDKAGRSDEAQKERQKITAPGGSVT